jgi:serine/threonine-protein kinase RsbW
LSSDGGAEHDNPRLQGPALVGPADEPPIRFGGSPWTSVEVDSALAPLISTGIPNQPDQLVEVRHRLECWAANVGLSDSAVADLVLATYEALANAAEHAYPSQDGLVDLVAARTTDGRVLVSVTDHGQWRPPPADPGFRGRGLQMIMALSHRAQITPGPHGTTVHMEWEV